MTDTHYSSSFLITVAIYTLFGLLFLSFADETKPIKKPKPKPQVVRIALVAPVTTKAKEKLKKIEPKIEKPKKKKPKKKKKIIKKKVIKKKITKKKMVKKKTLKKKTLKKKTVKQVVKPKGIKKKTKPKEIPPPVIEEYIPDTFKTPIYEPPPPPPVVYTEMPPEEIYYEPKPIYVPEPIPTAKAKVAQQQYIIHDPLPVQQSAPIPYQVPQTHAVQPDLSSEKSAFKRDTRDIINSNKRYPRMAKRRHIQGSVHVIFDILSDGTITNIRTSGASSILQKSARKSVIESSPLSVPFSLVNQFPMNNVSINIDFRLQ